MTLDNIMTGRSLQMKLNLFWQALRICPALDEEIEHRRVCEEIINFLGDRAYPQDASRRPALRLAEARVNSMPGARDGAGTPAAR